MPVTASRSRSGSAETDRVAVAVRQKSRDRKPLPDDRIDEAPGNERRIR